MLNNNVQLNNVSFDMDRSYGLASDVINHSDFLSTHIPDASTVRDLHMPSKAKILNGYNVAYKEIYGDKTFKDLLLESGINTLKLRIVISSLDDEELLTNKLSEANKSFLSVSSPKITKAIAKLEGEKSELLKTWNTYYSIYKSGGAKKKKGYLVLTDLPHIKSGISFYGNGWSSCQDTYGGSAEDTYILHLGGFLKEDAIVSFTDFSDRDIEEVIKDPIMEARSIIRHFSFEKETLYFICKRYGSDELNKHILKDELKKLGMHDLENDEINDIGETVELVKDYDSIDITHLCDTCQGEGDILVNDEQEAEAFMDCPFCDCDNEIDTEYGYVQCVHCGGSGEFQGIVYSHMEEYVNCPSCGGNGDKEEETYTSYPDDDMFLEFTDYKIYIYVSTAILRLHGIDLEEGINKIYESEIA